MKKTILIVAIALALPSCMGLTYQGKYGTYTATPAGQLIIKPNYAK